MSGVTAVTLCAATPDPASAIDIVLCSEDTTSGNWRTQCRRKPKDGDAGGVSGIARVRYETSKYYAQYEFFALGERSSLINNTTTRALFSIRVADKNGLMHARWAGWLEPGEIEDLNHEWPDNRRVEISVTVQGRGKAQIDTLRT